MNVLLFSVFLKCHQTIAALLERASQQTFYQPTIHKGLMPECKPWVVSISTKSCYEENVSCTKLQASDVVHFHWGASLLSSHGPVTPISRTRFE